MGRVNRLAARQAGEVELVEALPRPRRAGARPRVWRRQARRRGPRGAARVAEASASIARRRCSIWPGSGSRGEPRARLVEHDLEQPLPDLGTFDVVVSGFAIHHLADERKQSLLAEIAARPAPGGVFANLEVVQCATDELQQEFYRRIERPGGDPEDGSLRSSRSSRGCATPASSRSTASGGGAASPSSSGQAPYGSACDRSPSPASTVGARPGTARHSRPTRIGADGQQHIGQRREGATDERVLAAGHGVGHLGLEVADAGPGEGAVGVGLPARMPSPNASAASKSTEVRSSTAVNRNTPAASQEWRGPGPSSASRYSAGERPAVAHIPERLRRAHVVSRLAEVGAQLASTARCGSCEAGRRGVGRGSRPTRSIRIRSIRLTSWGMSSAFRGRRDGAGELRRHEVDQRAPLAVPAASAS